MKKFRTLELAIEFYQECQNIKLKGAIKNQFERASLSIVLNLSEGQAKPSTKDRRNFYYISYGSLKETMTILRLANISILKNKSDKLGAYIWKLAQNPGGL